MLTFSIYLSCNVFNYTSSPESYVSELPFDFTEMRKKLLGQNHNLVEETDNEITLIDTNVDNVDTLEILNEDIEDDTLMDPDYDFGDEPSAKKEKKGLTISCFPHTPIHIFMDTQYMLNCSNVGGYSRQICTMKLC